jgi:hypothetical protein
VLPGIRRISALGTVISVVAALAMSAPSAGAAPVKGAPGAPTNVAAVARDGAAVVRWTPPASDGGSPIIEYLITATPGGATARASAVTSFTVGGLTNGTTYRFTVAAKNSNKTGANSALSNPVVPAAPTAPSAPQSPQAVAGYTAATVSWSPPTNDGNSPISGYTVTASPGGATVSVDGNLTQAAVRGLTNGTSYTFQITAANAAGTSAASAATNAVVPTVTVPEAPASVSTAPAGGAVNLTWLPPVSDGGDALSGYVVTADPGGATVSTDAVTTNATITGLTDGTSYTFSVVATNGIGAGAAAVSAATTPDLTVAAGTVVLSSDSLASLTDVSNAGTLVFDNAPPQVTGLVAGDVVVAGTSPLTPDGLLRHVVSVSTTGGQTTVTTSDASLDDALSDGGVTLDGALDTQGAQLTPLRRGVALVPHANSPSMTVTIDVTLYKDSLGRKVTVTGTEKITPHISFSAGIHCCFHVSSHFEASLEAETKLALTAELEKEITASLPLATINFPPIEFAAGPVPVVITPVLDLTLEASGKVAVGLTTSLTQTDTFGVDIHTDGGDVDAQPINEHSTTFTPPTIFAEAEIKAGPRARLSMLLYGVVGPFVQGTIWLFDLKANTAEDPWWSLVVDESIGAGFRISVFGHELANWEKDPLIDFSFPVADAGGPFMGVDISPDPASVAPGGQLTLTANVERSPIQTVTWSVEPGGGTVSKKGVYRAPTTPGTYYVTATSPANGLKPLTKGTVGVVVGAQPPGAPSGVIATSNKYGIADVSWTPPTDNGGGTITGYEVVTNPASGVFSASGTSAKITGLTPRVSYRFAVRAVNAAGTGPLSGYSAPVLISDVIGGGKGVLIVGSGDAGNVNGENWLASTLQSAGYTVITSSADALPGDLTPFGQIWVFTINPLSTADDDRLIAFAEAGGGVYLTGERPCCEAENAGVSYILNQLVGGGIQVGGLGDPFFQLGQVTVNPTAVDGSTTTPFAPSTWTVNAPGGMSGVAPDNVFASVSGPGSTTVAAVWGADQVVGGGRVAVLMDVNWADPAYLDPTTAPQITQDLGFFLSGLQAPPAAPVRSAQVATAVVSPKQSRTAVPLHNRHQPVRAAGHPRA